eukprot:25402-Chlamydomonas_euryale.AAC.1
MAPVGEAVVEEAAEREDVHGASLSHGAARTRDELLGRLPAAAATCAGRGGGWVRGVSLSHGAAHTPNGCWASASCRCRRCAKL